MGAGRESGPHALIDLLRDRDATDDLIDDALDRVSSWSWRHAPSGVEREELHWAERENLTRGEEAPGEPPQGVAADLIGRDGRGELIYARLQDRRGDDNGEVVRFERDGAWTSIVRGGGRREAARAWRRGETLVEVQRAWRHGKDDFEVSVERYARRGAASLSIHSARSRHRRGESSPPVEREFVVTYDGDGAVGRIEEPDQQYTLYRRPTLTRSELDRRLEAFAVRLADHVFELAVAAAPRAGQGYALLLEYEDGEDPDAALLPVPSWGREESRTALIDEPEREFEVWAPDRFFRLTDDVAYESAPSLRDEAAILGWELESRADRERYRDVLVRASAELNRRDWSALPITSDFVVLAGEHELIDAHDNLRRAISPEQRRRLKAGGWLT